MTASRDDDDDAAGRDAAHWLVILEEYPDDEALRARFNAWLIASPANAVAWTDTTEIYALMSQRPAAAAAGSRQTRRRAALGAVAVALAACLALFFAPAAVLRLQADYLTSTGELKSVTLEDGSVVRLGPDSAIATAYGDGERRVRLLKGMAFFDVVRSPDRPFRVVAGELETTVLGTAFDIRLCAEGAAVAVRRGRVQVDYEAADAGVSERLRAGDWLRVGWSGRVERRTVPPAQVAAWLDGQVVARDRPMGDVVDELRHYYSGMIIMANEALGERRVTGVYNVADPVAALRAVAGAHGAAVTRISPWLLLVSGD